MSLGIRGTFADVAATCLANFAIPNFTAGQSMLAEIKKCLDAKTEEER